MLLKKRRKMHIFETLFWEKNVQRYEVVLNDNFFSIYISNIASIAGLSGFVPDVKCK